MSEDVESATGTRLGAVRVEALEGGLSAILCASAGQGLEG